MVIASVAPAASALQVQDIARLKGSEANKIIGMGIVSGLSGTGDGGRSLPAMRALARVIKRFNDANVVQEELANVKNVALVSLTAELPPEGVREGDLVDVHVTSMGEAKSLKGGRLFMAPLVTAGQTARVYAYAEGKITIEDEETLTVGVVEQGAQMAQNVMSQLMDQYGRITLVLNPASASWPVAYNVANLINGLQEPNPPIARAIDAKNVVVDVPMWERQDPAGFISGILQTFIDPTQVSTGAKVVINERTGTIVIGGDVEISPTLVSHKGLTITTVTQPAPDPQTPVATESNFAVIDPGNRGGAKLIDLQVALDQLKIGAQDRIEIFKALAKSGYLHAKLILK